MTDKYQTTPPLGEVNRTRTGCLHLRLPTPGHLIVCEHGLLPEGLFGEDNPIIDERIWTPGGTGSHIKDDLPGNKLWVCIRGTALFKLEYEGQEEEVVLSRGGALYVPEEVTCHRISKEFGTMVWVMSDVSNLDGHQLTFTDRMKMGAGRFDLSLRDGRGVETVLCRHKHLCLCIGGGIIDSVVRGYVWAPEDSAWYANHAHENEAEILICISGSVEFELDDGTPGHDGEPQVTSFTLSRGQAVYLPPMVWHRLRIAEPGSAVLVQSDSTYNRATYIQDYETFLEQVRR